MAQIIILTGSYNTSSARPIGAYQIANCLRNTGYTVQVIDYTPQILRAMGVGTILKILDKFVSEETLWIGFSSTFMSDIYFTDNQPSIVSDSESESIKKLVHCRNPKCRFVLGGAGAFMHNSGALFDTYIEGYADTTVIEFTKWCENKNPFFRFIDNGNYIVVNHDVKASQYNFTNTSFTWHKSDHLAQGEILPIELARGCIFKCSFCSYPLNGKKKLDYIKNTKLIYEEMLRNYENYNVTDYVYLDDTHNDGPEKLEILYNEVYSKLPFKINFAAFLRLDLLAAHPHTMQLLKDSGLKVAFFGIESLNIKSNRSIGKGISKEKIINTLDEINKCWGDDIVVITSFIAGLPYDSVESIHDWLQIVTSESFKSGMSVIQPLSLNEQMSKYPWAGDFIRTPENFGYTINGSNWVNNYGITSQEVVELIKPYRSKLNALGKNLNIPGFEMLGLLKSTNYNWKMLQQKLETNAGEEFIKAHRKKIYKGVHEYVRKLLSS